MEINEVKVHGDNEIKFLLPKFRCAVDWSSIMHGTASNKNSTSAMLNLIMNCSVF